MGWNDHIEIDELTSAIVKELYDYSLEVTTGIKKVVDTVAKEANEEIKKHINFKQHSGKYVKSFRIKKAFEDGYKKVNVWYVANGEHRLTHLLEKGHALRQGGRAAAFPHIKYGEELAQRRMEELSKEVIKNVGH